MGLFNTILSFQPSLVVPLLRTLVMASSSCSPSPNLAFLLKQYRVEQAYLRAVSPASVFSNKVLAGIVAAKPTTLALLSKVHGVGPVRMGNYGMDIVRLVNMDSRRGEEKRRMKERLITTRAARKPDAKGKAIVRAPNGKPKVKRSANKVKKPKKVTRKRAPIKKNVVEKNTAKIIPAGENANNVVTSRFFHPLPVKTPVIPRRLPPLQKPTVYVLELEDGRVYVGSSKDVERRISQHMAGTGSAYTRVYRPTGVQLPRLGNVEGDGDAAERDETLRYMMQRGIPYVRGWKFARVDMPEEEFEEAEANIRELFDLCRRCGYKGHFCTQCRASFDRLGLPIVS